MSYYAEVILEDDLIDDPQVVDGEVTRYENLRRISRASAGALSHLEIVEFEPMGGEVFTERCYFVDSGEIE